MLPDPTVPWSRLRICNRGPRLLKLVIEPSGRDYWLRPNETVLITAIGEPHLNVDPEPDYYPGPGTSRPNEPFQIDWRSTSVTVHCHTVSPRVTDTQHRDLEPGYQRPWQP